MQIPKQAAPAPPSPRKPETRSGPPKKQIVTRRRKAPTQPKPKSTATSKNLVACKDCGDKVSIRASACPHCGAKRRPARSSGERTLITILALIIVGSIVVLSISEQPASGTGKTKAVKTMSVGIDIGTYALTVRNRSTSGIVDRTITLYVNGTPPGGFKGTCYGPAVGQEVIVPLNTFIKKNGTRFNPVTHAVTTIWIGGAGYDYAKFTR